MSSRAKVSLPQLRAMKERGEKITMVTAYDYSSALLADKAGIDMILVGDSVGMVVLGYDSTVPVTMDDMVHHTKAVVRANPASFVVADLPFMSYQASINDAVYNAGRLVKEGGADAVKLEGGQEMVPAVKAIVNAGIPVVGHLGLTPQTVVQLGGYRVQGRDEAAAEKIMRDAKALVDAGIFALVLECVPEQLALKITSELPIPTIGIGAGSKCDGQVLVYHDLLGLFDRFKPKFVKRYAKLDEEIIQALKKYREEVREGKFPDAEHSFK
ncbi:MAG: 3-methyl-2-oxobutanoate hydroxymethyltransferase [Clostridia bacterium]|nr:3-methyl-2-oxobutanoate hydroxymethyltransferase [Clostridia bacterium]